MRELNSVDLVSLAIVLLTLFSLIGNLFFTRRNGARHPHRIIGYQKAASLMHESAETGRRLVVGLGSGQPGAVPAPVDWVGLPVLRAIMKHSVFNDQPGQAVSGEGSLACISQMIVRGAYLNAVAPELFRQDYGLLAGVTPMSYLAGLLPEVNHRANAGIVLSGSFRPEAVLALDLAERKHLPVVAASGALATQALFYLSSAATCPGEDYFLTSEATESMAPERPMMDTLDSVRLLVLLGLLIGALLKISGVLP